MSRYQRLALRLALVLFVASGAILTTAGRQGPLAAPRAFACCTGTFYGGNTTLVNNATQNVWPQGSGPYCGIETAIAITNYVDQVDGVAMDFTSSSSQYTVASNNNSSSAESQWGYALEGGNTVAGESNISLDFGTDPRSIAFMAWNYTPANTFFHDYIYRWQMAHSSAPPYSQQVMEATTIFAENLEEWSEPISVAINEGEHSVLVTGVYSTNNPLNYFPANITGVTYRDPMDSSHWTVDISTWTYGISGGYDLWKNFYGYNNSQDPEPSVGPYTPGPGQEHWFNGFNWIETDENYTNGQWSPDWSYDIYGGQMTSP